MHPFWTGVIEPLVMAAAPRRTLLISSGRTTEALLGVFHRNGCALDIADPWPNPMLRALVQRWDLQHCLHVMHGLDAVPLLLPADVVVLDGDSNWFTVYHELQLLFARAIENGVPAPLVFVHEAGWPCGRRDRYDDPGLIPERQDYACRGILPGQSALADAGVNGRSFNALHEGGPANGVLTAVEDFISGWPQPITLRVLPFFSGLAILVPKARMTEELQAALDQIFGAAALLRACAALEQDRNVFLADLAAQRLVFARRSEALVKARARIIELEQALATTRQDARTPAAPAEPDRWP